MNTVSSIEGEGSRVNALNLVPVRLNPDKPPISLDAENVHSPSVVSESPAPADAGDSENMGKVEDISVCCFTQCKVIDAAAELICKDCGGKCHYVCSHRYLDTSCICFQCKVPESSINFSIPRASEWEMRWPVYSGEIELARVTGILPELRQTQLHSLDSENTFFVEGVLYGTDDPKELKRMVWSLDNEWMFEAMDEQKYQTLVTDGLIKQG